MRLKLSKVRRLVCLGKWKTSLNAGLQAIFGSLNKTCKLYGRIERGRGHIDLAWETSINRGIKERFGTA